MRRLEKQLADDIVQRHGEADLKKKFKKEKQKLKGEQHKLEVVVEQLERERKQWLVAGLD